MGQQLFEPPSVKGWDGGRSWINTSTLFIRQNLAIYLLTGQRPEQTRLKKNAERYLPDHLLAHLDTDARGRVSPEEALPHLCRLMLGTTPHPSRIETLARFVEEHGNRLDGDRLVGTLCLITSMPEYQLC